MVSCGARDCGSNVSQLYTALRLSLLDLPFSSVVLARILPHLPLIVYLLGLSGLFGATLFFSFASDLLAVLTFHVFVFYLMATSLFRWHLLMLGTLFNIFRGRPTLTFASCACQS